MTVYTVMSCDNGGFVLQKRDDHRSGNSHPPLQFEAAYSTAADLIAGLRTLLGADTPAIDDPAPVPITHDWIEYDHWRQQTPDINPKQDIQFLFKDGTIQRAVGWPWKEINMSCVAAYRFVGEE